MMVARFLELGGGEGLLIARTVIQLGRITSFFFQPSHRDMRKSKNNSRETAVPVFGRDREG